MMNDAAQDPYFAVALSNGFVDYFENGWVGAIPVLIEITPTPRAKALTWVKKVISKGSSYDPEHFEVAEVFFFTATITLKVYQSLIAYDFVVTIELATPLRTMRPMPKKLPLAQAKEKTVTRAKKAENFIGVIDDGCPFGHRDFLDSNHKTRFVGIWDQDVNPDFVAASTNPEFPAGWTFGQQVDAKQLNSWIRQSSSRSVVDETKLAQVANNSRIRKRISHGSHVLGLAAGKRVSRSLVNAPSAVEGPESDGSQFAYGSELAFVQLPRSTHQAPTRGALGYCILNGVKWLQKVGAKCDSVTTVIDYGSYLGPHDGNSLFERALDSIIQIAGTSKSKLAVVFPAGNGFEHRTTAYIPSVKSDGASSNWAWWIPPQNEVATFMEIWIKSQTLLSLEDCAKLRLVVTPPHSTLGVKLSPGESKAIRTGTGTEFCNIRFSADGSNVLVRIAATSAQTGYQSAPSGRWNFALKWVGSTSANISAWVYANRGGRSINTLPRSHLSHLIPLTEDVIVDGRGSIIGTGCSTNSILLGGVKSSALKRFGLSEAFTRESEYAADYSGSGEGRGGVRITKGPDGCAITDESSSLKGIAGIGNRSGSSWRMVGTSTAPPQLARLIANGQVIKASFPPAPTGKNSSKRLGEFIVYSPQNFIV